MISSKPSQYIKGWVEFYKLKFNLTPDVLIPRPETELLVDETLKVLLRCDLSRGATSTTILDVGTGSGCISISIAKSLSLHPKGVRLIATDISEKALNLARQNARLHGVEDKIEFMQSDLLKSIDPSLIAQDDKLIIVTNLPYIPTSRISILDSSVKDFEPHLALDGGADGFDLYRKLFSQIKHQPRRLHPKLIICEIDHIHGNIAIAEAKKFFPKAQIEIKKDFAGQDRILLLSL